MFVVKFVVIFFIITGSLYPSLGRAQSDFTKLVVFGDSLSDTGNLAFVDFPPPYFENRISDGPVSADFLALNVGSNADRSGHLLDQTGGFNFAVAGGNIVGADREDLSSQVTAYLDRTNGDADSDALYLIFIGGNDIRGLRSIASLPSAESSISEIVASLEVQIDRLVAAGARAFLVPNVANIGRLPETIEKETSIPGVRARSELHSRAYNSALASMLEKYKTDRDVSLVEFDLFGALETILDNPASFGFSTVDEGCFDPSELEIELECALFGFERRPFFDSLHPSSATNRIISAQLTADLPVLIETSPASSKSMITPIILLLLDDKTDL